MTTVSARLISQQGFALFADDEYLDIPNKSYRGSFPGIIQAMEVGEKYSWAEIYEIKLNELELIFTKFYKKAEWSKCTKK